MSFTLPIPQTTLDPAHGPYLFPPTGGQSVADSDTLIVLSVDRTVTGGFNATPGCSVEIKAEQSNDGGATWFLAVAADVPGGIINSSQPPKGTGLPITTSLVRVSVYPGTGRLLRATLTPSGAPVVVAGTLTVS
jgi:hypothetical protein